MISDRFDKAHFGNGLAIFGDGHLVLRFMKDRGQTFLDVGSKAEAPSFVPVDEVFQRLNKDLGLALNTSNMPDNIMLALAQIRDHYDDLPVPLG